MTVYRLASEKYIGDTTGMGARLFGGRWNPKGVGCLYASSHISLALLERFVHAQGTDDMSGLQLLAITLPDDGASIYHTDVKQLKSGWENDFEYSQWLGEQLLNDASIVAFSVPSAVVPSERNVILNPQSVDFDKLAIGRPVDFMTDFRLLAKL